MKVQIFIGVIFEVLTLGSSSNNSHLPIELKTFDVENTRKSLMKAQNGNVFTVREYGSGKKCVCVSSSSLTMRYLHKCFSDGKSYYFLESSSINQGVNHFRTVANGICIFAVSASITVKPISILPLDTLHTAKPFRNYYIHIQFDWQQHYAQNESLPKNYFRSHWPRRR